MVSEAISDSAQTVYTAVDSDSDIEIDLAAPQSRIAVRVTHGVAGRAEARFVGRSWAAKHYWSEGEPGAEVTIYEFDEPLPAGRFHLRVPISPGGKA